MYRGGEVASDQHLLVAKLKVKLKTLQRPRGRKKNIDVENLGTEAMRKPYQLELKNIIIHFTRNQRVRRGVRRGRRQRGYGCSLGKVERCGRTDGRGGAGVQKREQKRGLDF